MQVNDTVQVGNGTEVRLLAKVNNAAMPGEHIWLVSHPEHGLMAIHEADLPPEEELVEEGDLDVLEELREEQFRTEYLEGAEDDGEVQGR